MRETPTKRHLVLASQSPIRARLLRNTGLPFESVPAPVDEAALIRENRQSSPAAIAIVLATAKAQAVGRQRSNDLVIGADQVLDKDGAILQKPSDRRGAEERLALLSGRSHRLVTAVVVTRGDQLIWQHVETATLTMHDLSSKEIVHYLDEEGADVLQSVGAYRLEGPGIRLFARLDGDYFAMLGLPLVSLLAALRQHAADFLPGVPLK
jgi:septum formation protein